MKVENKQIISLFKNGKKKIDFLNMFEEGEKKLTLQDVYYIRLKWDDRPKN